MRLPSWLSWIRSGGRKTRQKAERDVATLRSDFNAHYHSFQLLLTANSRVLEMIAEMEDALLQERPIGMSFVRSRCTRITANVFQIIKRLDEIAPGKYSGLFDRFKVIQQEIDSLLAHPPRRKELPLALSLAKIDKSHEDAVGAKMANLGELGSKLGLTVPPGFVMSTSAYWRFVDHNHLQAEISELIQAQEEGGRDVLHELSDRIQTFVAACDLPTDLHQSLVDQYHELEKKEGTGVTVVMRSSAIREDELGASFAGQYLTEFNVTGDTIAQAYKNVVASKYSVEAIAYRRNRGIRDDAVAMCVGCLPIVNAKAGGVAYSRNPLDVNDDSVMIFSTFGLPKPVVDGSAASDVFMVSRNEPLGIVRRQIKVKEEAYRYIPEQGICRRTEVGPEGGEPSLTDEQILELAEKMLEIEKHFGSAEDVEWALSQDDTFVYLQSRRLKQLESKRLEFPKSKVRHSHTTRIIEGGVTASPGVASGPVVIVHTEKDAVDFPVGGVLVAAQALPLFAALLNRVAAVVSEQGTEAGHLASVARELGVPALLGVDEATFKLENGKIVTVDADSRVVHKGRIEGLLERPKERVLLGESPVYQALKGAVDRIAHLNLIDQDSPRFRPRYCKTLHDITRFCHEKAVWEMFNFGAEHKFVERSAKQLRVTVPMQFWIIDLDDGFKPGTGDSRFVELDEITSIPMLALWRGMMTIPWKGPPPVDARGFIGVLMESAANPALNPAMPSAFAERNYFMISKKYCSLQSRFGYHFASTESLVGDRPSENFVAFRFSGGAANLERRIRRTRLVVEVLEDSGFRTKQKKDNVFARLEGYDKEFMEKRLMILGFLMFHTRQLDMVMTDNSSIARYKKQFYRDLEQLDITAEDFG